MKIDPLIIIAGIFVLIFLFYFVSMTMRKRKAAETEYDLTTEIEKLDISPEQPPIPDSKGNYFGEIEIIHHDKKIRTTKVFNQELKIGRDPATSTVIISEPTVSKLHCVIFTKDDKVMIKDNNSTNGTFIDSIQITEQEIKDNDIISLGKKGTVKIVFHKGKTN
jgi:pSer/pThr/pTyr-binding forkhead associated (FHA) protein